MTSRTIDLFDNHFGERALALRDCSGENQDLLRRYAGLNLEDFAKLGVQVCTRVRAAKGSDQAGDSTVVYDVRKTDGEIHMETWNCMGVLRFRDPESKTSVLVQIKSRFDDGVDQPFLVYLLGKVFGGAFLDMEIPSDPESPWDILLALMFRKKLVEACEVGLYRQYRQNHHNDLRFRGKFDLDAHLKLNIPFTGKIAYSTRDISFDNPLNQLIRHAMSSISQKWPWLLQGGNELTALKHLFEQNTPTWDAKGANRCTLDRINRQPVRHPLYAAHYEPLRRLSLALLHDEGATPFEAEANEVEGFIFDGAWLWEEYLNTFLKDTGFHHPRNKTGSEPEYLFVDNREEIFPDFWREGIVIDAKYKHLEWGISRSDRYQLISYMHVLPSMNGRCDGYLLFPHKGPVKCDKPRELKGLGGFIGTIAFPVPSGTGSFQQFAAQMKAVEEQILSALSNESEPLCYPQS